MAFIGTTHGTIIATRTIRMSACTTTTPFTTVNVVHIIGAACRASVGVSEAGVASWYGGRHTPGSGSFTAAHRSFPMGTRVLVTNADTGRSVVVRINDRGPFVRGRVIDLSRPAARAVGISGVGAVKLKRL